MYFFNLEEATNILYNIKLMTISKSMLQSNQSCQIATSFQIILAYHIYLKGRHRFFQFQEMQNTECQESAC